MAVSFLRSPYSQGFNSDSAIAMGTDSMDVDMDIDLGPIQAPVTSGSSVLHARQSPVKAESSGITSDHLSGDAIIHKVHIRGVDDLTTGDLKAFAAEHHPADLPTRVEWIDDTSANIVYSTPAAAMEALKSFSLTSFEHDATLLPLLPLRPAKAMSNHPESRLQVRTAISTDIKRPRAHEASRFYMLHPEHDPREKARRQKGNDGRRDYRRQSYGDDEHRRRRPGDKGRILNLTTYGDDPGNQMAPIEGLFLEAVGEEISIDPGPDQIQIHCEIEAHLRARVAAVVGPEMDHE
ncbi:MAG: hypothetical protein LQ346_003700 [Caloplaca aetnensis]|nr:MAG: hypothetical protein LQ346_003700 [Caloplaca aetnensis]